MKNIHVLPTDKPSRLFEIDGHLIINREQLIQPKYYRNIYITSDEEIKDGDYYLPFSKSIVKKTTKYGGIEKSKTSMDFSLDYLKKIILTTDQDLIKDGVQAIPDEFLEWFVKNPSCEYVKVISNSNYEMLYKIGTSQHKIIIPKEEYKQEFLKQKRMSGAKTVSRILEEPKQETLEDAMFQNGYHDKPSDDLWREGVEFGVKWQAERMYSEEEVREFVYNVIGEYAKHYGIMIDGSKLNKLFEQFKKK